MDILNVRKVNRTLHKATKVHSVWLAVLDRACARHGIFKPTFPTDRMSALELEDASAAPFKFLRSIERVDEGDYPLPFYSRVLQFHSGSGSTGKLPGYDVKTVHLLPGGRFLLTTGPWYCLWDLGRHPGSAAKPFPMAEALYHGGSSFGALIPSQDGNAVILGTSQYNNITSTQCICLHKIDVTAGDKTHFQPIATLEMGIVRSKVKLLHLSETVAVMWANPDIVVWDWVTLSLCRWSPVSLDFQLGHREDIHVLASGQTIFVWDDDNNLQVFDLPNTYAPCPTCNTSDVAPIINRPKSETPSFCIEGMTISSTTAWQSSSSVDQFVCTVFPGMSYFRLYSVKNSSAKNNPFLPGSFLVPAGKSDIPYGPGHPGCRGYGEGLTSLRRFEEELVLCSQSPYHALVVMVLPVPTGACLDEIRPFSRALTRNNTIYPDEEEWLDHRFDFCPFSGRAVYISQNRDVFVSDYVLPSYET